jgi:hypothetical protein
VARTELDGRERQPTMGLRGGDEGRPQEREVMSLEGASNTVNVPKEDSVERIYI